MFNPIRFTLCFDSCFSGQLGYTHVCLPDGVETPSSLFTHYLLQPASAESVPGAFISHTWWPTFVSPPLLHPSASAHQSPDTSFASCCERLRSVELSVSGGAESGNFIIIVFPIKHRRLKQKWWLFVIINKPTSLAPSQMKLQVQM